MTTLSRFNLTVENLINDLITLYPDKGYLKVCREKFNILKNYNPKLTMTYFIQSVYPYKEQIQKKEDSFFLEKDYNTDVNKYVNDMNNSAWALDRVLDLKNIWNELSDKNKETIWTYFNVLIKLVDMN